MMNKLVTLVCLSLLLVSGAACTTAEHLYHPSYDNEGRQMVMDVYDKNGNLLKADAELGSNINDTTASSWLTPGVHTLTVDSTLSLPQEDGTRKVYTKTPVAGISAAGPSGLQHAEAPIVAAELGAAQYFTGRDQNVPGGDRVNISSSGTGGNGGDGGSSSSSAQAEADAAATATAKGTGGSVTLPPPSKGGRQPCKEWSGGKGGC